MKRTFMTMYQAVAEELRDQLDWFLPQVRWSKYIAIVHEDGLIYQEHRLVIWRQWMGRTYDYTECLVDDRKVIGREHEEEEPWHVAP